MVHARERALRDRRAHVDHRQRGLRPCAGHVPEFRAGDDFNVKSRPQKVINVDINNDDGDLSTQFTAMLHEISSSYSLFPFYVLEIMAENFGIPLLELKILVKNYQQKGILIHLEDGSYKIYKIFKRN